MIIFNPQTERIIDQISNLFPFNNPILTAWEHNGTIFIIEAKTGIVYELNTSNNILALSEFQIFENETYYNPMVSKDESTGIIYLISGREGNVNNTVRTNRKLVPIN